MNSSGYGGVQAHIGYYGDRRRDLSRVLGNHAIRLVNVDGWCHFYVLTKKERRVYDNGPPGCRLHPVVYSDDGGAIVDELCPMGDTVSEQESKTKVRALIKFLKKIDDERKCN